MKLTKTLALAAIVAGSLLVGNATLQAQDNTNTPPAGTPAPHAHPNFERVAQELGLTDDQQQQQQHPTIPPHPPSRGLSWRRKVGASSALTPYSFATLVPGSGTAIANLRSSLAAATSETRVLTSGVRDSCRKGGKKGGE